MNTSGYDPDRFVGSSHQPFQCPICTMVVREPYECHQCGKLFCKFCITGWSAKGKDQKCPNRCGTAVSNIKPIFSKALQKLYFNLEAKCSNPKCKRTLSLLDLPKHEASCNVTKCWNNDLCDKVHNKEIESFKPCCSELCLVLLTLH